MMHARTIAAIVLTMACLVGCDRTAQQPAPAMPTARTAGHDPLPAHDEAGTPLAEGSGTRSEPVALPGGAVETLITILQQSGIPVVDRTERLGARSRVELRDLMQAAGASGVVRLWVGTSGEVDALSFDDEEAMRSFIRGRTEAITHRLAVMVPAGPVPATWGEIASAFEAHDGVHFSNPAPVVTGLDLNAIRTAVSEYRQYFIMPVDFPASLWSDLVTHGFLEEPPLNPDSPTALATRIVVVGRPGQTGAAVSAATAGWVWNRTDQRLYLAGRPE